MKNKGHVKTADGQKQRVVGTVKLILFIMVTRIQLSFY